MGTPKTTTGDNNTAPANPNVASAVSNISGALGGLPGYTPYQGILTAQLNPEQQAATGTYNTGVAGLNAGATQLGEAAGMAQPYYNSALGSLQSSANPLTAGQIQDYYNPYQKQVIDATTAWMNQQNAIQQMGLLGNAAQQGALGGNRVGIAQAALAGQQQLSEAPVIAGLEQQGYTQAFEAAQQQYQQNPQQAAYGLITGATQEQQMAQQQAAAQMQAASGQMQAGVGQFGLGTQQQQFASTVPYQPSAAQIAANYQLRYLPQQAFPYQQLGAEAGILGGVGALGGTNSNFSVTQPPPSIFSSLAGLGVAGLGAGSLLGHAARGGAIPYRPYQGGGATAGSPPTPYGGAGYIPQSLGQRMMAALSPPPPVPSTPQDDTMAQMSMLSKALGAPGASSSLGNLGHSISSGFDNLMYPDATTWNVAARGGAIPFRHFEDGGGDTTFDDRFVDLPPAIQGGPIPVADQTNKADRLPIVASPPVNTLAPAADPLSGQATSPPIPLARPAAANIEHWNASDQPPATPLSPADRDRVIKTVYGEAGNQAPVGQAAVASVIRNRLDMGKWGKSASDVVTAPYQFEPWNTQEGRSRMNTMSPEAYQKIGAIVDQTFSGQSPDPTGGATHFFAPGAQAALGRPVPEWGRGQGLKIGDHLFFKPGGELSPSEGAAQAYGNEQPASRGPLGDLASSIGSGIGRIFSNRKPGAAGSAEDPRMAQPGNTWGIPLIAAGLGMMASRSPYAGVGIGQGGLMGLQAFQEQRKEALTEKQMDERSKQLERQMQHITEQERQGQEHINIAKEREAREAAQPRPTGQVINPQTLMPQTTYSVPDPKAPGGWRQINATQPTGATPTEIPEGEEYLKTLGNTPGEANLVRGVASGDIDVSKVPMRDRARVLREATQYDPSFNTQIAPMRASVRKNFVGTGVEARNFQSNEMAIGHLGRGLENVDRLNNFSYAPGVTNRVYAAGATQLPGPYRDIRRQLQEDIDAVGNELMKSFRGTGTASEKEALAWKENFPINGSPDEQRAAFQEGATLLGDRVTAAGNRWNDAMGPKDQRDPLLGFNPDKQDIIKRAQNLDPMKPWSETKTAAPAAGKPQDAQQNKPQFRIQNGHTFDLQPDGSYKYRPGT